MNRIRIFVLTLVASLTALQPIPATAQVEGFIRDVGTVLVLCAITGTCNKGQTTQAQPQRPANKPAPAPRRAPDPTVMSDQSALNYFGFPAGTADGFFGNKTQSAISAYQGYMGFPITGALADHERSLLMSSYQRTMAGAAGQYPGLVATEGVRGLLRGFQREALGQPVDPTAQRVAAAPPPSQPAPAPAPAAQPAVQASGTSIFPLLKQRVIEVSMTQYCGEVSILTTANGRVVSPDSITDPQFALDEQFCAARGYAISRTQQLSGELQSASDTDMEQQCRGLAEAMAPQVSTMTGRSPTMVAAGAINFMGQFGMTRDQLASAGEVCLGLGYRIDDSEVVLAAAMVMVGAGQNAFAEVLGHHLRKGFGTPANSAAAKDWYNYGLAALESGQTPAFLPTQSAQRAAVIRNALAS